MKNSINNMQKPTDSSVLEIGKKGLAAVFKNYDAGEVMTYFREDYIQHNPHVPTGRSPLLGLIKALEAAGTTHKNHRAFQDGNYAVMHTSFDKATPFREDQIVTFEIFRIDNNQIAEHWDAVQPIVDGMANGRNQINGETALRDLDKTDANKATVKSFVTEVLIEKKTDAVKDYLSTDKDAAAESLGGLHEVLAQTKENKLSYSKAHKILGQGNMVFVLSEGSKDGKAHAFYDLYSLRDGKVVAHWNIINAIPEKAANANGMF